MENIRTILLVDDEQDVLETVTSYLSQQGFQVVTASRWTEAIAQFQETPPDLVLLDLYLPTVQGEALLAFIRELNKDLPVVMISSDIDAGKMEHLSRLGANGFLQKPFETDDLLVVVEQVLAEQAVVSGETVAGLKNEQGPHASPPATSPEALPEPLPTQVSPGAEAEALQREREETARRGRSQRRGRRLRQIRNYILAFILFVLIAILLWTAKKTLVDADFLGFDILPAKEQVK